MPIRLTGPPRGLWTMLWLTWWRRLTAVSSRDFLKWLLLGPLTVIFLILTGYVFEKLWSVLWTLPVAGPVIASTLWSAFLSFVCVFLFYSHLLTTLSTFYAADDLPLLLSSPLPFWKLHIERCVETIVRSSAMMLFLLIPALATQWQIAAFTWAECLRGSVVLFGLLLGAGLLGIWTGQVVASLLPAKRISQVLILLGLAIAGALVVAIRATRLEMLWADEADITELIGRLTQIAGTMAQFRPAREAVSWLLGIHATQAPLMPYAILAMLAAGFVLLSFRAESRFWSGWRRAGQGSSANSPWPPRTQWLLNRDSKTTALFAKDLLTELRTGRRWSQLLMMIPLGAVYVINLRFLPGEANELAPLFGWLNFLFAAFLVVAISTRFLVPAASMEGRAAWVWLSGPVTSRRWFFAKLAGYLPVAVIGGIGFFILGQWGAGLETILEWKLLIYVFIVSFSIGVAALALGAAFPVADVRHELQASLGTGGLLFIVASLGYLTLLGYVLIWPALGALDFIRELHWHPNSPPGAPWAWIAAGSAVLVFPPSWLAIRRWRYGTMP